MTKLIVFFSLFIWGASTHAGLKKIAQDFLENNSQVKVAEAEVSLAELDLRSFELTRNTNLSLESNYSDSQSANFSAFAVRLTGGAFVQPIVTSSHALTVGKDFNWGGSLSFSNTYQSIKIPGLSGVTGFEQAITYNQNLGENLFGRTFYLQRDEFAFNLGFTKADSENTIQNSLLNLVNNYYNAALNKALVKLQSEAKQRAKRRLSLIKRRVRDGLREKVDRIQAEISLFQAEEAVKTAQQNFTSALESLSTAVHRGVPAEEVLSLNDDVFKMTDIPSGEADQNKNVMALKELVKSRELNLSRTEKALIPDINLSLAATNNDFNVNSSDAISGGLLGKPNRDLRASLNVSWELGSEPEKVEKTRSLVNLKTSKLQLERLQKNVIQTEKSIKDQINLLSANLKSSKKRLQLARKALKEYNKLYERGRADLDRLIQAEETLIDTEISHIQYLAQRERLIHSLAFLYGDLRGFLLAAN